MADHYGPLRETTVRIATWNLWWRHGPFERRHELVEEELRACDADVVCLQEVWSTADGTDSSAHRLADALGYPHVAHTSQRAMDGFGFGNALLSRWEHDAFRTSLPAAAGEHADRTVIAGIVHGPRGPITVLCTHLDWQADRSALRQQQLRSVLEVAGERSDGCDMPAVVCGDLNAPPDSDEIRMLTGRRPPPVPGLVFQDAWEVAGDRSAGFTSDPSTNRFAAEGLMPPRRVDYVLVGWPRAGGAGHPVACRLLGTEADAGVHPSDHYGVVADLRY